MQTKAHWNSTITIPHSTFALFFAEESSFSDAFALYYRYIQQVQMQGTSVTKSTDNFMQAALNFGNNRLSKAKKQLIDMGLIRPVPIRWEDGRVNEWKLEVFIVNEGEEVRTKATPSRIAVSTRLENHPSGKQQQTILTTNSNNSNINYTNSKIKENQEEEISKVSISPIIIKQVYSVISKQWIAYTSTKEDTTSAFILSKDKVFIKASEQVGWVEVLVKWIMDYSYEEPFWKWKIISIQGFHKHWQKLYSHLLVNKKFKPVVSKANMEAMKSVFDSI